MSMWDTPETVQEAAAVHEFRQAKGLVELETIRRELAKIGPTLLAVAYFCAMGALFLAMIYYHLRGRG